MPVVIVPGTKHAEEVLKFEYDTYQIGDERGKRGPRVFVEYPKMLYKAGRDQHNKISVIANETAGDSLEESNLLSRGFSLGQVEAIDRAIADEREVAKLAANRAYNDRKMSPEAQAEAAEYEQSVPEHV
ncbi:MAG: hypothetical protein QG656_368, partial [Candidatus Hydrogenedentes bacterium]|nr:hypothetical protein [Candidatus Hydrogenedentota bacterium]